MVLNGYIILTFVKKRRIFAILPFPMTIRERITPKDLMTLTGYSRNKAQRLLKSIGEQVQVQKPGFTTVADVSQVLRIPEEKIRKAMVD